MLTPGAGVNLTPDTNTYTNCEIAQWKQRFRCLKHMRLKFENSLTTIVATACLHNVAKERSIPLPDNVGNEAFQELAEVMPTYTPETNSAGAATRQ